MPSLPRIRFCGWAFAEEFCSGFANEGFYIPSRHNRESAWSGFPICKPCLDSMIRCHTLPKTLAGKHAAL